ncbi:MAG: hypothetical protein LBR52_03980 [Prevotellaceae bacterium]|jgi:hypothetical protein|nr:hypothetical protein [Prevotellaceae bacterium]
MSQIDKIDSILSLSAQLLDDSRKFNAEQKTPIFEQYNNMMNLLFDKVKKEKSAEVVLTLLLQAQQMNQKIVLLKDKDCKELIKEIKKSKPLENKFTVFLKG